MKKIGLFAVILWLLLPCAGMARDRLTWEQRSTSKLTRSVTTYAVDRAEDGSAQVREMGSLPAGTHVVFADYDRELQLSKVIYMAGGSETAAFIRDRDALVSTIKVVRFDDGSHADFPEALVNDRAALLRILNQMYPERTYSLKDGSSILHVSYNSQPEATRKPAPTADTKDAGQQTPKQTQRPAKQGEESQAETAFNIQSPWRLKQSVTGYQDAHMTKAAVSIPLGTYAQITMDYKDVVQIGFYLDGVYQKAHIYRAALLNGFTQYRDKKGDIHNISPADPNYASTIAQNEVTYLADSLRENLDNQAKLETQAAKKGTFVAQWDNQPAMVEQLGLHRSRVSLGGEEKEVPSTDLVLHGSPSAATKLAYIHAPRTGKCSLRASGQGNGKVIKQCKAGTVVPVLSEGEGYSLILYKGVEGYVLSDCLRFGAASDAGAKTGVLVYQGKKNGTATINLRNSPQKGSAKVAGWKAGTEVTILSVQDGWAMVEAQGLVGYVMEAFITGQ